MAGEDAVADRPGLRGAVDVTDAERERLPCGVRENRPLDPESRHAEGRHRVHVGPRPRGPEAPVLERRVEGAVDEHLAHRALRLDPGGARQEVQTREEDDAPDEREARGSLHV